MHTHESSILVHYGEIALRGRNRPLFEEQLVKNIKVALMAAGISFRSVCRLPGRIMITGAGNNESACRALTRVFGIVYMAKAQEVAADYPAIERAVLEQARGIKGPFRVKARRATKQTPFTSRELNERIGAAVQKATGAAVNLSKPDTTFYIDIVNQKAFVYLKKIAGPGGLPVGTSGRVAVLLSGGIDSPVAAWYAAKRGCPLVCVHFHSYPYTSKKSQANVKALAQKVGEWAAFSKTPTRQIGVVLYAVPLGEIQQRIIAGSDPKFRVLLYRRAMVRLAQDIARKEKARALVTGESVGQVASQTIENIAAVSAVAKLPILRPLAGFDKTEIIDRARRIGTYDISILPYEDCCSYMVPSAPETKANLGVLERAESRIDFGDTLKNALAQAVRTEL